MDRNLEDIDSLSVARFAVGGPVGQMPAAQPIEVDGPLSMALGGLIDINSLSTAAFAEGGEAKSDDAYTEAEIARMREAMQMGQAQRKEQESPTRQAVKRIIPRPTAQGPQQPQQPSTLARQQLYALPPYSLDMAGKLGRVGPIRRAEGSPEYGEVADQELIKQIGIFEAGVPGYKQNIIKRPRIEQEGRLQIIPRSIEEEPANAFVASKNPRVVTFDEDVAQTVPYVAAHEFEHQLEGLANERYYRNKNTKTEAEKTKNNIEAFIGAQTNFLFENLKKAGVNGGKAVDRMKSGLASQEVKNYLSKKLNLGKDQYFGRIGDQDQPLFEYIADLSGIETHYGIDLTQDPVIRKKVFGDDDRIIQAYKSVTGLRQQRLDAKDLPPYTYQAPTGKLDSLYNSLKDSTTRFIRRAEGSPEYGEIAQQMTVGTLPMDQGPQGPSLARQGLDLLKQAGQTVYGNLREAVTDPVAFNKRALGNVAQQLQSDPQEFIMNWTGGGLGGIIKPKGGNVLLENVDKAIADLRPHTSSGAYAADVMQEMRKTYTPEALTKVSTVTQEYVANSMKNLEPLAALDNWIQNKLGRYIRTEMGSEADPVRKLADEMSEKVQADYQAGLKRIAKMKDDIAKAKAKGKNTDASEAALEDEIDKVEAAFQETSKLPIQLGPYTHPALRTGEAREKAGFSPFPISKSNLGKQWEEEADEVFIPHRAGDLVEANSPDLAANPWIAKINPNEMVYSVSPYVGEKQMFTHTIDELENALRPNTDLPANLRLKPEDLEQLSIEKAFRQVNKINDWRMQQRAQASLEEANRAATTFKEYPNSPRKLKWQELKAPTYTELPPGYEVTTSPSGSSLRGPDGQKLTSFNMDSPTSVRDQALQFLAKNDLERALKYEGSTMRHCVGGYCDDVWTNQTRIFSLRDNKGEPHVTIETAPADIRREGNTPRDFLLQNGDVGVELGVWPKNESRWPEDIDTFLDDRINNFAVIQHPKFREWLNSKPQEILQIKGKGNDKPNEKYIPFIQDFVTSGNWSRVGDLANTDLVKIKPQMLQSLQNRGIDVKTSDIAGQPHITKQEFNRLADLLGGVEKYPD